MPESDRICYVVEYGSTRTAFTLMLSFRSSITKPPKPSRSSKVDSLMWIRFAETNHSIKLFTRQKTFHLLQIQTFPNLVHLHCQHFFVGFCLFVCSFTFSEWLHLGRNANRLPKQTIPGHLGAHDPRHHWSWGAMNNKHFKQNLSTDSISSVGN